MSCISIVVSGQVCQQAQCMPTGRWWSLHDNENPWPFWVQPLATAFSLPPFMPLVSCSVRFARRSLRRHKWEKEKRHGTA